MICGELGGRALLHGGAVGRQPSAVDVAAAPPTPHFGDKLLVELHPAPAEGILVSREKANAVKAWLEG